MKKDYDQDGYFAELKEKYASFVLAEIYDPLYAIYYNEDGIEFAEFDTPDEVYSEECSSLEEFVSIYNKVVYALENGIEL